jgi:uncharacterized protein DUF397
MWYKKHDSRQSKTRRNMDSRPVQNQSPYPFFKSYHSGTNGCVEVAFMGNILACIRDSKNPKSPILTFSAEEWEAFINGAKDGQFDLKSDS